MKTKSRTLLILVILGGIVLISGCTGLDPQALATANPMIKQFLNEHPNAKIVVTHFTAEQAKKMIDQIRSDCDNPYLDEKEFYRVNITDPDTNFYAIVWIDWNSKTIECVFKLGTEGKVVEKPKPANCTAHSYAKCYKNHIYWFDSCGNMQDKKEYCQYGCSEEKCLGECKSQAEYRCYGDNVYWFDSCGNKQEKKEYCNYGCENGFCKPSKANSCESAGGYCIYPGNQPVCGNGICEPGEADVINVCPAGTQCQPSYKGTCPQDCMTVIPPITPYSGGGGGVSEEAQSGCEKKCTASNIKFADFWTDKETYSTGDAVRFYAKLIDNNGEPATPEEGNKVYIFAVSPTAGSSGSSAPTNYNYSSGYYESTTPPIPTSNVESGTWIFFATAEKNESFAGSEDVYVKINPAASSALPTANPAPYEGCINRCLMRFRMSEPLKPVMQPSSAHISTGMVIATETTATSTIVSYQCKEGYEVGKYFCKEGGICCIPKAPQPTQFCGSSTQGTCSSDSECIKGGCSGQVCQSIKEEKVPTTCEYKDCYSAEKFGMVCSCLGAKCKWTPATNIERIGYRNAYWQCYDGSYDGKEQSYEGDTSCTSEKMWRQHAEAFCNSPCVTSITTGTTNITKCGINTFKVWNECSLKACADSDGGKNYYMKGIVTGNDVDGGSLQLNDVCEGKEVHEYFCQTPNPNGNYLEKQNYGWVNYPCPYACKDGVCISEKPVCGNGVCEAGEETTCSQDCGVAICKDYDGKNYYVKGMVATSYGQSLTDNCNDDFTLIEKYCEGNEIKWETYKCPAGCKDGACIQQTTPPITVLSPNGGETLAKGQSYTIGWKFFGKFTSGFDILLQECTFSLCASSYIVKNYLPGIEGVAGSQQYYAWDAKTFMSGGGLADIVDIGKYKILVRSSENSSISDTSDAAFSIVAAGTGTAFTSPYNTGEIWDIDTAHTISWSSAGNIDKVSLNLVRYDGSLLPIVTQISNTGSYSWLPRKTIGSMTLDTQGYYLEIVGFYQNSEVSRGKIKLYLSTIQPYCTDSDGGKNYYVKGTTTYNNDAVADFCSGSYITEGWCENNIRYQESYQCPNGCSDGACIESAGPVFLRYLHFYREYLVLDGIDDFIYADMYVDSTVNLENVKAAMNIPSLGLSQLRIIGNLQANFGSAVDQFRIDIPRSTPNGKYDVVFTVDYTLNGQSGQFKKTYMVEFAQLQDVKCVDYDGDNKNVKSSAVMTLPYGYVVKTEDACCTNCMTTSSETGPSVWEFTCENNQIKLNIESCPNGCSNGACI